MFLGLLQGLQFLHELRCGARAEMQGSLQLLDLPPTFQQLLFQCRHISGEVFRELLPAGLFLPQRVELLLEFLALFFGSRHAFVGLL